MVEEYLLGHSASETQRLVEQAELLAPITRRILLEAGIKPGMRVLDVGTGMGDVALLAAELVGTEGSVVGVDTSPAVIRAATERLASTRQNISFVACDPLELPFNPPFDAIVGRYVLMFLREPDVMLSALRGKLRIGGCIAFHELDWSGARSNPVAPTYDRCCRWAIEALRLGGAEPNMGSRLYGTVVRAGYAPPQMHLESIIGGSNDPSGAVSALFRTLFPEAFVETLEQHGVVTAAAIDSKTLPDRMSAEIASLGSVIVGRSEIGVWARRP
jgi:SAM-dependent methyltransferase